MTPRWIKFAASAACLAAVLWWIDSAQVFARLQGTDPKWVALALIAATCATLSMARRWQVVARAFDIDMSYGRALREYYLSQFVNTVLPGGVVGDVSRAVRARAAADFTRAAQSVMAERLAGQIAMLGVLFVGFALALVLPGGLDWGLLAWGVLATLAAGGFAAWASSRADHATGRFLRKTAGLMRWPSLWRHGVITTACLIFAVYASARAIGVQIPAGAVATLIPLILCAMLIPLSVGGWGWREGAAAALFPIIGAPASAGVASGIVYGVVLLAATLPAGLLFLSNPTTQTNQQDLS